MTEPNLLPWDTHEEARRSIKVGDSGYNVLLDRAIGLWYVEPQKGPLPKNLDQRFTSAREANLAIKMYVDNRK